MTLEEFKAHLDSLPYDDLDSYLTLSPGAKEIYRIFRCDLSENDIARLDLLRGVSIPPL